MTTTRQSFAWGKDALPMIAALPPIGGFIMAVITMLMVRCSVSRVGEGEKSLFFIFSRANVPRKDAPLTSLCTYGGYHNFFSREASYLDTQTPHATPNPLMIS
jgi:hypothetical protein